MQKGPEDVTFGDLDCGGIRGQEVAGLKGEFKFRFVDCLICKEEEWAEAVTSEFAGGVSNAVGGEDIAGEDRGEFDDAGVKFAAADGKAVWGTFDSEDDEFFGGSLFP